MLANSLIDVASMAPESETGSCPLVEHGLADCRKSFRLRSIQHAMSTCFGEYSNCPVYQACTREGTPSQAEQPAVVVLTVRRQEHVKLRPTGS
ncbi:MAG: hypothetical protein MK089_01325 [Phycisphaerales bacterium]|nr:hypothetical protein [Phycisphaerales bacterium]